MATLQVLDLGPCDYACALDIQKALVEKVKGADPEQAFIIFVEHTPPVITIGRSASGTANVVASRRCLAEEGVELVETSRGGDVTYHGPGQLVAYPIIRLDLHGRDIHKYLRSLEEVLINVLRGFGISGERAEGMTGVWVGREKVAAIGIAITRWVTYHGVALNVSTDLSHFGLIVPCGLSDRTVTSIEKLLGRQVGLDEVKPKVLKCFSEVFGFDGWADASGGIAE
ncbi:MAG: lipoyl(octanoyl) transferase LipB [Phycisphaerae bacterium]|jgi:lipoate-protein ligase B|nr:lipoyl(octanoyl) transferase LipB [Phycisphaerae bacterium]